MRCQELVRIGHGYFSQMFRTPWLANRLGLHDADRAPEGPEDTGCAPFEPEWARRAFWVTRNRQCLRKGPDSSDDDTCPGTPHCALRVFRTTSSSESRRTCTLAALSHRTAKLLSVFQEVPDRDMESSCSSTP